MSEQDNATPDFNTAQAFTDAAFEHGERTGNDDEISDLQSYFQVAFGLLTQRQREAFLQDETVRANLKASGIKIPETPKREDLAATDEIPRGQWGSLRSKAGKKILGTEEKLLACALIKRVVRLPDGKLEYDFDGETKVFWDGQMTSTTFDGLIEFVDEDYNTVTEDEVILVADEEVSQRDY